MVLVLLKRLILPSPSSLNEKNHFPRSDTAYDLLIGDSAAEESRPSGDGDLEGQRRGCGHESDDSYRDTHSDYLQSINASKNWWAVKPSPRVISDAIIGLSDGLTVPFALTAGLSELGDTRLVVIGGLAELFAGAISMGLGGYIGAKSEAESYNATLSSTRELVQRSPQHASQLATSSLQPYSFPESVTSSIATTLQASPPQLVDFLMRFHHEQSEPEDSRPLESAATIALGYFIGGFIPLLPYIIVPRTEVFLALWWSIGVMAFALFSFGWVKTAVVRGWSGSENRLAALRGAVEMVVVGGVAAGAAVGLVKAINSGFIVDGKGAPS